MTLYTAPCYSSFQNGRFSKKAKRRSITMIYSRQGLWIQRPVDRCVRAGCKDLISAPANMDWNVSCKYQNK